MTDEQFADIRRRLAAGENLVQAARALGLDYQKVYYDLRGRGYRLRRRTTLTKR